MGSSCFCLMRLHREARAGSSFVRGRNRRIFHPSCGKHQVDQKLSRESLPPAGASRCRAKSIKHLDQTLARRGRLHLQHFTAETTCMSPRAPATDRDISHSPRAHFSSEVFDPDRFDTASCKKATLLQLC
uniref:Uncharacterized protein n=1 Tax=Phytophthora infestans TaxID=4787 RepID=Q572G3_PHYIN|nr:hypothetical protein PI49.0200c [Phytophthora infestans]